MTYRLNKNHLTVSVTFISYNAKYDILIEETNYGMLITTPKQPAVKRVFFN